MAKSKKSATDVAREVERLARRKQGASELRRPKGGELDVRESKASSKDALKMTI